MVVKVFDLDGVGENGCSTANFHMVVKDRQCMLKHTLSCSTARFRMVVKASGTGVYMQMNEYGTDLDGY
ncbi:hypothetical protein, partial [Holdemanella sp.]|uniref:hypothetical protein n=1 Tax=Holdemanella sp. TaxID=1971762 RepID=UPI00258AD30C